MENDSGETLSQVHLESKKISISVIISELQQNPEKSLNFPETESIFADYTREVV